MRSGVCRGCYEDAKPPMVTRRINDNPRKAWDLCQRPGLDAIAVPSPYSGSGQSKEGYHTG